MQTIKLGDKRVQFRKWKVKDKNKYLADKSSIKDALVYDCLEDKDIILSNEEYKYLLLKIRDASTSQPIQYTFDCESCKEEYVFFADLDKIITYTSTPYGAINDVVMGPLRNREFYDDKMRGCSPLESELYDFILHIHSFKGNDVLSFDELLNTVNDMDVDEFEEIFSVWNDMKFTVDNMYDVTCPHCGNEELYEFDDLPNFFPVSWR